MPRFFFASFQKSIVCYLSIIDGLIQSICDVNRPPDLEMRIMKAPYTFQAGQRVRTPDGAGVCIAFNPRWFGPDSGFGVVDLDEGGTWEGPGADITLEATA
jgi:hypothetical protein